MAINREDIFRVADELDSAGQRPTLAAVRKVLGGGSFTTISEFMTEWRAGKALKQAKLREPAPATVQDRLMELGAEVWGLAITLANARLDSERQALEATRLQVESEHQEAIELADQLSAELELTKQKVQALEDERVVLLQSVELSKTDCMTALERAVSAETRVIEITRRADDLNTELARVNTQNGDLIRAMTEKISNFENLENKDNEEKKK